MSRKLTAVGVYIFAGGFTWGVRKSFNVLAHLEEGPFGTATARLNYPKLPIHEDPLRWPLKELKGKVDFVYCNPPCAPWSATGKSSRLGVNNWKTDDRVSCVRKAFHALEIIRPRVWVWESVTRAFTSGRELVDELTQQAHKLGYGVTYFLTDAQLHGLPQRRQRFHLIVHNVELSFPQPSLEIISASEALRGVRSDWFPRLTKKDVHLMKKTGPGVGLQDTFNRLYPKPKKNVRGQVLGRPTWMNFRINGEKPTNTLIGACHAVHPTEHRFISPHEQAALCGYPKEFKWAGPPQSWYAQISRAVTPVIGEYLGRVAKSGITKAKKLPKGYVNTVDFRKLVNTTEGTK